MDVKRTRKHICIFFIMGLAYMLMEVFFRWFGKSMVGFEVGDMSHSFMSATGWTSVWMMLVGGLCGFLIGRLNEVERSRRLPLLFQCLIGTVCIVLPIELFSGIILNIWLELGIWDYSNQFANVLGQICLKNGIAFFCIAPFAIWLDDALRHYIYKEEQPKTLMMTYLRLLTDFKRR